MYSVIESNVAIICTCLPFLGYQAFFNWLSKNLIGGENLASRVGTQIYQNQTKSSVLKPGTVVQNYPVSGEDDVHELEPAVQHFLLGQHGPPAEVPDGRYSPGYYPYRPQVYQDIRLQNLRLQSPPSNRNTPPWYSSPREIREEAAAPSSLP